MMIWPIIFLTGLLILSGLFSSVETAYTSLSPGHVNALAENQGRRGERVKRLTERPNILLTTLLIGNNLANLGASALATSVTIRIWGNAYVAAATGVLTLAVLIFCEVSPKQIALVSNEPLALGSARIIWFLSWVFRPLIWGVTAVSSLITRLFSGGAKPAITLEHLLYHVKAAEDQGVVESFEEEMVRNVFRINDTPVEAIMTHRTDLFFIDADALAAEALDLLLESGHTRAPIVNGDLQHVCGILTLANLVRVARENPESKAGEHAEKPHLVPGTLKAHELFFRFKKEPIQIAVVLDEYGGLDGVVTREDMMEEIFGNLYDEREASIEESIRPNGTGGWMIQGDADFYDVSDTLGLDLEHDNRTHTLGGYLLEKLGRIPVEGTRMDLPEGHYIIRETRKQRITEVEFTPAPKEE